MDTLEAGFAVFPFWVRFLALAVGLWVMLGLAYGVYRLSKDAGDGMTMAVLEVVKYAIVGAFNAGVAVIAFFTKPKA
jgi:hypothetical protein